MDRLQHASIILGITGMHAKAITTVIMLCWYKTTAIATEESTDCIRRKGKF